ncbi:MAG TPA: ribonuclease HI [Myxococcota bacterium]|nr:ribonuclease HI [Myxococcota bacterium]
MSSNVIIYCDGSCLQNPGPGGFAALLLHRGKRVQEKVVAGYELHTTNNRMELRAAIEGLKALTRKCHVTIYCDSLYVVKGMTEWMAGWQKSGFKNSSRKTIANADLWQELLLVALGHTIQWRWVRGHAGEELNERVDEIAREQAGLALHLRKTQHG